MGGCGEPPAPRVADAGAPQSPLAGGPVAAAFDGDAIDRPPGGFTVHTIGPPSARCPDSEIVDWRTLKAISSRVP